MINLLIGYMWLFIHRPFEVWQSLANMRIERAYVLLTIAYWAMQPKTWTANWLNKGVALIATSMLISTYFSPYVDFASLGVQNWLKLALFYVLLITSVRSSLDLKRIVVAFVVIMGLYELHSLREYFNGRGESRMGIWRMVGVDIAEGDPNSFAASVIYGIPMLLPVRVIAHSRWQKAAIWGLLSLSITCVLLTGSRGAFTALLALALGAALMSKHRWRVLAIVIVSAPMVWLSLSKNLQNRYLTLLDPSYGPANAQVSAESRMEFFHMAVDIWKSNVIFGVGPWGFSYASGTGMQSHSLYAETIADLGTFGVIAMCVLLAGFLRNYYAARRIFYGADTCEELSFCYATIYATSIGVLLLLYLGFSGHNLFRYTWLWYAAFSLLALRFLRNDALMIDVAPSTSSEEFKEE